MALDPITNFGKVTVSTGYGAADISVALSPSEGSKLPDPALDGAFNLVWYNATDFPDPSDDPEVEIVRCTARSGDDLTILRAQEDTEASIKDRAGKTYKMLLAVTQKTAGDLVSRENHTGTQTISTVAGLQTAIDARQHKLFVTVGSADADYITDGSADEVQIQAAIDAVANSGGGTVYLRQGTYTISSSIQLAGGVWLRGSGIGATVLERNFSASNGVIEEKTAGDSFLTITDMTIDDKSDSFTGWDPIILIGVSHVLIERVETKNAEYHGIEVNDCTYVTIRDVVDRNAGTDSYQVDRTDDAKESAYILFESAFSFDAGSSGFDLHKKGIRDVTFKDCYAEGAAVYGFNVSGNSGPFTQSTERVKVINCVVKNAVQSGIVLSQADESEISGNTVIESGLYGIRVSGVSTSYKNKNVIVSNNHVRSGHDVTITSGGSGYSDASDVAITGGTGTGATVDITTVGGAVTEVRVNKVGTGYAVGDAVTVSGGGANATFTINNVTRYALTLDFVTDSKITQNAFELGFFGATADSIIDANGERNTISYNYIDGANRAGIHIDGTSGSETLGAQVIGNTIKRANGPAASGILLGNQKNSTIENNRIYNPTGRAIHANSSDAYPFKAINNYIEVTGGDYVISWDGRDDVVVQGNRIVITSMTASKDAISVFNVDRSIVRGNYISGASRAGIHVWSTSDGNIIEGNTVTGSAYGLLQDSANATNTVIENNNFYGNTTSDLSITNGTRKYLEAPSSAVADGRIPVSQYSVYQDEANSLLKVKWKSSGGTVFNQQIQTSGAGVISPVVTKTAAYTATASDYVILVNASSAAVTITLPTAVSNSGRIYSVKKIDSSANVVTVDGNGSETIDGSLTCVLTAQYQSIIFASDGANWFIVGRAS